VRGALGDLRVPADKQRAKARALFGCLSAGVPPTAIRPAPRFWRGGGGGVSAIRPLRVW